MKKLYFAGFSLASFALVLGLLMGSYTAVGVASCEYCKVKEIASTQSDALDTVASNEMKKDILITADNKTFKNKLKADAVVAASFMVSRNKVKAYEDSEQSCSDIVSNADIEFNTSVLKRLDETATYYRMAADTLIGAGSAGLGSASAESYNEIVTGGSGGSAAGAFAKSDQRLYQSGRISAGTAKPA